MWLSAWLRRRPSFPTPDGAAQADGRKSAAGAELVRYLEHLLGASAPAEQARERLTRHWSLPAARQHAELASLYLLLEQELVREAGNRDKSRSKLRQAVRKHFAALVSGPDLVPIFAPPGRQELLLCRRLLSGTLDHAFALLGATGNDFLRSLSEWLDSVPNATLPVPFDLVRALPRQDSEWVAVLLRLSRELYLYLEGKLGESCARSFYERSYMEVSSHYAALESFPVIVHLLPEKLLDSEKIEKLNRRQIQQVLLQKLKELNDINAELRARYDELDVVRREVVAARDELEHRVAERTAELSASNRLLEDEIAERQRAEQELRSAKEEAELANRAKGDFLANMSHELRTPLNAIIGFSEIMKNARFGPIENTQYQTYAEDIHGSGEHLLTIINEILDMAKVEAGKVDLDDAEVHVHQAVDAALRLVKPRASDAGVDLRMVDDPDFPLLLADERLLRQMLLNLLSNAVKFTAAGGTVTVEAAVAPSGEAVITVRDTGIGIAPDDLSKVLLPFGQADSRLSRQYGGTGLGLPLAKSFVELHGGTLAIDSELGVGTIVMLRFPPDRVLGMQVPAPHRAQA